MHAVLVTDLSSCIVVTENGGNKQLTGMGVILSTVHAGVMALPLHFGLHFFLSLTVNVYLSVTRFIFSNHL